MRTNEASKTVVHFIPGDGPNGLIQAISVTTNLRIKLLTLYTIDETVPKFCAKNDIEIITLGFSEKNLVKHVYEFLKYLYREKPRLVFAHSFYPSLICAFGRLFYWKARFVPVWHHNRVHIISKNRKAIFLDRWISRITSHTVGVSEAVKETLVEQGCSGEKISVIYNGLPSPAKLYSKKLSESSSEPFKLVAIGRIDWQKDYEVMLEIVYELRRGGMDLVLTVLGGGNHEYLEALQELQARFEIMKDASQKKEYYEDFLKFALFYGNKTQFVTLGTASLNHLKKAISIESVGEGTGEAENFRAFWLEQRLPSWSSHR